MKNQLKEKMKAGERVIGTFVEIGHPDITEWLSRMGFDWILLDAEHGPLSFETMQNMMQSFDNMLGEMEGMQGQASPQGNAGATAKQRNRD